MDTKQLLLVLFIALSANAYPAAAAAPAAEEWLVLRSGTPEAPHILSVRPSIPAKGVRSDFPVQVTLHWSYEPNDTGLPASEAELKAIYAFEEALRARDPDERVFLQAIRRTGNGARTWVLFTRSEAAFRALLGENPGVTVEFAEDPSWSALSTILGRVRR